MMSYDPKQLPLARASNMIRRADIVIIFCDDVLAIPLALLFPAIFRHRRSFISLCIA